ncbi:MBL fold metallo-hydrolase [Flaviflexus huanghaiensis]|uniref:MBL fold metallo-hydrolase n=1 Tax=Flaviflexus huanghaiensis TaxID=1111473 RepID=UPI0015FE5889|nr:MBL fold metallo-hydrolase [Flaviflexus huanghaiensis]
MRTTYHTGPDQPPVTIALGDVTITKMSVGSMDNNVYLLENRRGDAVIVDAAAEPDRIVELAADKTVHAIITTHEHEDHIEALETVSHVFPEAQIAATSATAKALPLDTDLIIENGAVHAFGDLELTFITLRGHTPEGCAVVVGNHILTGDSLFPGGIGQTPSDQAFFLLFNDVRDRIFAQFDNSTVIHPGHGDSTTLGDERPHLDEWEGRRW